MCMHIIYFHIFSYTMLFRKKTLINEKGPFILMFASNIFISFDDDNTDVNDEYSEEKIDQIENCNCKLTMHLVIMIVLSFLYLISFRICILNKKHKIYLFIFNSYLFMYVCSNDFVLWMFSPLKGLSEIKDGSSNLARKW